MGKYARAIIFTAYVFAEDVAKVGDLVEHLKEVGVDHELDGLGGVVVRQYAGDRQKTRHRGQVGSAVVFRPPKLGEILVYVSVRDRERWT